MLKEIVFDIFLKGKPIFSSYDLYVVRNPYVGLANIIQIIFRETFPSNTSEFNKI